MVNSSLMNKINYDILHILTRNFFAIFQKCCTHNVYQIFIKLKLRKLWLS